ncbi:type I toxin-antitoxin system SymE family toxin [Burkholderia ambifaria]|uniref:SymE family type I addiction module toxin n=1 Tax=Burkholderia ambifaria TaxID=152480 RepID=UPI001E48A46A|nr:SymE family type I addiction module toxin [Burkholderia ambifaria]UEP21405.1 type I toxin-antitoxin system SymE family toxin [Burkholderia ambifaria]
MCCHPYDPLTTTNSQQESETANANRKSRPVATKRFVTVQESARHHSLSRVLRPIRAHRKRNTTYFPWIKLAGVWLEDAGFEAGECVRITVEDKRLITTPMCSAHCHGGRRKSPPSR